ncbi:hypothetical protein [Streptomyces sp. ODS28]|uniref:hypothetical protein n=1 Tax=Streptomyces sp. ODS28 TaxID=3136688 RepID=UPI0031EA7628
MEQVLDAASTGFAYQTFADGRAAGLVPGAPADLLWLDSDTRGVRPMRLRRVRVLGTRMGGKSAYRA